MRVKSILHLTIMEIKELLNIGIIGSKQLKAIINAEKPTLEKLLESGNYPLTLAYSKQCYNSLNNHELKISMINELLHTSGSVVIDGDYINHYWRTINYVYCNAGDIDNYTVCYGVKEDKFFISCYADIVESMEKSGGNNDSSN